MNVRHELLQKKKKGILHCYRRMQKIGKGLGERNSSCKSIKKSINERIGHIGEREG